VIAFPDFLGLSRFLVEVLQPKNAQCCLELTHLPVNARSHDLGFTCEAEVDQVVDVIMDQLVMREDRSPFECVEHLRRMEARDREIAMVEERAPAAHNPKSMGRIVDHFQSVRIRDRLDGVNITRHPVDMNRHDSPRSRSDSGLNLERRQIQSSGIDVTEYRRTSVPVDCVCSGCKREWCCDDFPFVDPQNLQGNKKSHGAVAGQVDVRKVHKRGQVVLELLLVLAEVR